MHELDILTKESTLLRIENTYQIAELEAAYLFNIHSKEFQPFQLIIPKPREIVPILGETDSHFLVIKEYQTTDEYIAHFKTVVTHIIGKEYALIAKEDYWNGEANYLPNQ